MIGRPVKVLVLLLGSPDLTRPITASQTHPKKGNVSRVGEACSGYALPASPHTGFSSRLTRVLMLIVARQAVLARREPVIDSLRKFAGLAYSIIESFDII